MYIYDATDDKYIYFDRYTHHFLLQETSDIPDYVAYMKKTRARFTPAMTQLYDAFMAGHDLRVL